MSLKMCYHCRRRRAAHRLEMSYPTPMADCVCGKCLRDVDGRQITAQSAIDPLPEIRPTTGVANAPDIDRKGDQP